MKKRSEDMVYYLALFILSVVFMLLTGDATAFVFLSLLGGYLLVAEKRVTHRTFYKRYNETVKFERSF